MQLMLKQEISEKDSKTATKGENIFLVGYICRPVLPTLPYSVLLVSRTL